MGETETIFASLRARAKGSPQKIAFAEAFDDTVLAAANQLAVEGLGIPVLVGDSAQLKNKVIESGYDIDLFQFADLDDKEYIDSVVLRYTGYPTAKLQDDDLREAMKNPLMYAMAMQALGDVRLAPAGYIATTADVVRAALKIIRPDEGGLGSSVGMVTIPESPYRPSETLFLADISTCPDPNAQQLAQIAIASCDTAHALTGVDPICAMLSYSTKGSAGGPIVEKVVEATRIANELRPDLNIDGEFQFDAAINPAIGLKKAGPDNPVAGRANVLVFPDLNASNIAVKILEHFAGAKLFGAILQGFRQVCTDSSRGATLDELVGTILAATVLAVEREKLLSGE